MSTSVADMQLFFMGLHDTDHTFSCKNMDQLSSLWAAFTKCKRNIRDGFRLENMSWRLWYREAMIRKRLETTKPSTTDFVLPSAAIETNSTTTTLTKQLVRTRSLPSLSCQAQHIMDSCQTTTTTLPNEEEKMTLAPDLPTKITTTPKRSKFYIDQEDSDNDDNDDLDSLYDQDGFDMEDDDSFYSTDSASSSSSSFDGHPHHLPVAAAVAGKPISLLTHLLQKESSSSSSSHTVATATASTGGGLRRSHCYGRLDQWFTSALAS